jgi:hypothetical protein
MQALLWNGRSNVSMLRERLNRAPVRLRVPMRNIVADYGVVAEKFL